MCDRSQNIPGDWNYYPHFTDRERAVHFTPKFRPQVYHGSDLNPGLSLTGETPCDLPGRESFVCSQISREYPNLKLIQQAVTEHLLCARPWWT